MNADKMKNISKIFKVISSSLLLCVSACQHDIDPDELTTPPDVERIGAQVVEVANSADIEKELLEIEKTPYPPYRLQGGDRFRIRVYNEDELNNNSSASTIVTPDGYIVMDAVGPVMVKDMTIVEATEKLEQSLKKLVKHPQVSLMPEMIQGKTATLLGAVREPGEYSVTSSTRLADLIAKGKGYAIGILDDNTIDLADINNAYIVRDGKMLPVDFYEAIVRGNQLHNIRVFPGDLVYIPKREDSRVMVIGEVKTPRVVNWKSGTTFMDIMAYCGGLADDYWKNALVIRKAPVGTKAPVKIYKIAIDDVIAGRAENFALAAGDIVYIPKDAMGEYNVFVKKLLPTAQLINLMLNPPAYWFGSR